MTKVTSYLACTLPSIFPCFLLLSHYPRHQYTPQPTTYLGLVSFRNGVVPILPTALVYACI
jgi:hypothetical protein